MKSRVVLMCVAMTMLAGGCTAQTSRPSDASLAPVVGVWRAQMEGLPAMTLTVTDEGGSLTGAVLFYLHRREPGQPATATPGVPEPLSHPQFDGKTLMFQVSHRRAHPPGSLQDGPVTFRLMLDGAGNAALVNESEPDPRAPAYVLVKSAY